MQILWFIFSPATAQNVHMIKLMFYLWWKLWYYFCVAFSLAWQCITLTHIPSWNFHSLCQAIKEMIVFLVFFRGTERPVFVCFLTVNSAWHLMLRQLHSTFRCILFTLNEPRYMAEAEENIIYLLYIYTQAGAPPPSYTFYSGYASGDNIVLYSNNEYQVPLLSNLHFRLVSLSVPRREARDVRLPPVWNLRAVIWFHFTHLLSCSFA